MNELSQWAIALSVAAVGLGIDHALRRLDSRNLPWLSTRALLNLTVLIFVFAGFATTCPPACAWVRPVAPWCWPSSTNRSCLNKRGRCMRS